jgi:hypothetical protein
MPEETEAEQIAGLKADAARRDEQLEGLRADAVRRDEQIEGLEAEAARRIAEILGLEADALLRDERVAELVNEVDGLTRAREHAAVIEQAKGVIMGSMGCGPDAAFAVLIAQSQSQNRKLRDIASQLARAQERDPASS